MFLHIKKPPDGGFYRVNNDTNAPYLDSRKKKRNLKVWLIFFIP